MAIRSSVGRLLAVLPLVVVLGGLSVRAQDALTIAKVHYASAAYEEALTALASAGPSMASHEVVEVFAYRAYCLLALGRTDEARAIVQSLVLIDPVFRPAEAQVSPRVRAFFDEVRRPLLPDAAWQAYGAARDAFEQQDPMTAIEGFDRVNRLLADMPEPVGAEVLELRRLATGFSDLAAQTAAMLEAKAAAEAALAESRAEAEASAGAEAAAEPVELDPDHVYADGDPGVLMPQVVSRPLPPWIPPPGARGQTFAGVIELVIGADGKVESSRILESIYPLYDSLVLSAARTWQFRPATRDGVAVKYLYRLAVRMGES